MQAEMLNLRVKALTWEAEGVLSLELRPLDGGTLPPFTAGAHVDLALPNGMVRSYSLTNPEGERHRYVVAVGRDRASRGGSSFIHERLRPGDRLQVTAPRNNFHLVEDARHTVLIAGGIGITPIYCMAQRLTQLGLPWELHFSARTRQLAAFLEPLQALAARGSGRVHPNFDEEPGGRMLDLRALVASAADDAHFYCCGPVGMLNAFEAACAGRPSDHVHLEYFAPKAEAAATGGFTVELARSGKAVFVPPGKTILHALIDAGVDAPYSCEEGVCGTCETKVLAGVPEHRDAVLSKAEQDSNTVMMICCSGCKGERLTLDL